MLNPQENNVTRKMTNEGGNSAFLTELISKCLYTRKAELLKFSLML